MSIRDIPVILGFGFAVFSGYITDTVCPGCPMRLRSHEVSGPILNGSYPEVPLIWMSEVSKKDLHILKSIQIRSNPFKSVQIAHYLWTSLKKNSVFSNSNPRLKQMLLVQHLHRLGFQSAANDDVHSRTWHSFF